jgi:hypothetical protein
MLLARGEAADCKLARELLTQALQMYQSLGMSWHAQRAGQQIRNAAV